MRYIGAFVSAYCSSASSDSFGTTPTDFFTALPSRKEITVGMLST